MSLSPIGSFEILLKRENLNPILAGSPVVVGRRRALRLRLGPPRAAALPRVHPDRARAAHHDARPEGQAGQARRQGQDSQGRQEKVGSDQVTGNTFVTRSQWPNNCDLEEVQYSCLRNSTEGGFGCEQGSHPLLAQHRR